VVGNHSKPNDRNGVARARLNVQRVKINEANGYDLGDRGIIVKRKSQYGNRWNPGREVGLIMMRITSWQCTAVKTVG